MGPVAMALRERPDRLSRLHATGAKAGRAAPAGQVLVIQGVSNVGRLLTAMRYHLSALRRIFCKLWEGPRLRPSLSAVGTLAQVAPAAPGIPARAPLAAAAGHPDLEVMSFSSGLTPQTPAAQPVQG